MSAGYEDEVPFNPEDVGDSNTDNWDVPPPPELPPAGAEHEPFCSNVTFKLSSKGDPQIVLDLQDPELDTERAVQGRVYLTRSRSSFGFRMWKQGLAAFGLEEPAADESGRVKPRFTKDDFVGKKVKATVKHEEYEGAVNAKYDNLQPPASGAGTKAFGF